MLFLNMIINLVRNRLLFITAFFSLSFSQTSSQHTFVVTTDEGFIDYANRIIVCRGTAEIEAKTPVDNSLKLVEKNLKIETLGITIVDHESGVKVISIDDVDSSLQNGDIITEVNREIINNMISFEELVNSLEKTGRSSILLKIIRDDEQNWVTIKFKNN